MKRKFYLVFWTFVLILALTACKSKSTATVIEYSSKAIGIGSQAVSRIDEYLDGKTDDVTTREKLDKLYADLEEIDKVDIDEKYKGDDFITTDILLSSSSILNYSITDSADNYNSILEHRNNLAERVGKESRDK